MDTHLSSSPDVFLSTFGASSRCPTLFTLYSSACSSCSVSVTSTSSLCVWSSSLLLLAEYTVREGPCTRAF